MNIPKVVNDTCSFCGNAREEARFFLRSTIDEEGAICESCVMVCCVQIIEQIKKTPRRRIDASNIQTSKQADASGAIHEGS